MNSRASYSTDGRDDGSGELVAERRRGDRVGVEAVGEGGGVDGVKVELEGAESGNDEDRGGIVGTESGGDVNASGKASVELVGLELVDECLDTGGASYVAVEERENEPEGRISCL
jgi:hypothetical protein